MRRAVAAARRRRARQLLLAHLSPEQAKTYIEDGYFQVEVDPALVGNPRPTVYGEHVVMMRYRPMSFCLHRGADSVIFELDGPGGGHLNQLCTHMRHRGALPWPVDDVVLAHKLMLESGTLHLPHMAKATCWRIGHQPPDLRGPYFEPQWCRQALPAPDPQAVKVRDFKKLGGELHRIAERFIQFEKVDIEAAARCFGFEFIRRADDAEVR